MPDQTPIEELVKRVRTAKTMQEITHAVALLLHACGIYNFQAIGQELARISVTSGLGRN